VVVRIDNEWGDKVRCLRFGRLLFALVAGVTDTIENVPALYSSVDATTNLQVSIFPIEIRWIGGVARNITAVARHPDDRVPRVGIARKSHVTVILSPADYNSGRIGCGTVKLCNTEIII